MVTTTMPATIEGRARLRYARRDLLSAAHVYGILERARNLVSKPWMDPQEK